MEGDDSQKIKRVAAAAYDYENDSRWADYWSNILIPPNLASRPEVLEHYKRKFYQRYIDPELVVEAISTTGISQSVRQPTSSSTSNDQPQPRRTGSTTRTTDNPTTTPGTTPPRWDSQTIQFSINAWVFVVSVLAILPIVPRPIAHRAYRLSFMGTSCSSLYSLYSLYGLPRAWNLQTLQSYLQSIVATKDFIYFFYSISFVTSHLCLKFALIPILCRTLEHVSRFLRRNFTRSTFYRKYLEDACVWVESNTTTLSILSSHAEIGVGCLLIISLLSWQRNIIQTFIYWQLLKLMYHAPVTAGYHRHVWEKIGRVTNPLVHHYCPFLNTPISAVQRWWFR